MLSALVGHAEHFKFGIEVVDVVEGKRFRGAREGGRAELQLSVVGGDEVEEVETNVVACGIKGEPALGCVPVEEVAPEFVDEFDAERNVSEHFAMEGNVLGKARLRVLILPELATVVKEDASDKEVLVEARVDGADRAGTSHHLGNVFQESPATGMVILFGCRGPTEAFAELVEKELAESREARVFNALHHGGEILPIAILTALCFGVPDEESGDFLVLEPAEGPAAGIDAILILSPSAFEPHRGAGGQGLGLVELGVIVPSLDGEVSGGIDEGQFEIGIALFRLPFAAGLQLRVDCGL